MFLRGCRLCWQSSARHRLFAHKLRAPFAYCEVGLSSVGSMSSSRIKLTKGKQLELALYFFKRRTPTALKKIRVVGLPKPGSPTGLCQPNCSSSSSSSTRAELSLTCQQCLWARLGCHP